MPSLANSANMPGICRLPRLQAVGADHAEVRLSLGAVGGGGFQGVLEQPRPALVDPPYLYERERPVVGRRQAQHLPHRAGLLRFQPRQPPRPVVLVPPQVAGDVVDVLQPNAIALPR